MVNVNLNINSKKWLIVGGGVVATRRTKKILSSGAIIKIVFPIHPKYSCNSKFIKF